MLIIADDLTGAADAAAPFAVAGHETAVALGADSGIDAAVLSIDTHGRAMVERDAIAATAAATAAGARRGPDHPLFVKIDSTMRGHVRATVAAVIEALDHRPAGVVVCPAFPSLGRTVVDGCVHVDAKPLASGNIRDAFEGFDPRVDLLIPDVSSERDLEVLIDGQPAGTLWVGSAGLARSLAMRSRPASQFPLPRHSARQVLIVVGSRHPRTLAQLAAVEGLAVVAVVEPRRDLARQLDPLLTDADALVLTGGFTARAVLGQLGITAFSVGGEVETGVPWGVAERDGNPLPMVTKAGGFGDELTLRRAVEFLGRS